MTILKKMRHIRKQENRKMSPNLDRKQSIKTVIDEADVGIPTQRH